MTGPVAPPGADPARSGPFSRTALVLVVGVVAASLIGAVLLTVFVDDLVERPSASSDGYSVSALGHRGLVEVLGELDVPVVVSRHGSAVKAGDGLLIVAEPVVPPGDQAAAARLHALVSSAQRVLLVLPKWRGVPDPDEPRWLDAVGLLDAEEVDAVLDALGAATHVERMRPGPVVIDDLDLGPPDLVQAEGLAVAQLTGANWDALHALDGGGLVSWFTVGDSTVYLLSDPDVINNAGLTRPGNARFAVALIDELRGGGPVVLDETLHGHGVEPSLWRALFRFPLGLVTLHVLLLAVVVVWAGIGRFGPGRSAPPPLGAGKAYLVANTAALLRVAGHHGHALERYLSAAVDAVRAELHGPRDAGHAELVAWLERIRAARGGTIAYPALTEQVAAAIAARDPRAILAAADRVHRWRLEMTHGPHHHP